METKKKDFVSIAARAIVDILTLALLAGWILVIADVVYGDLGTKIAVGFIVIIGISACFSKRVRSEFSKILHGGRVFFMVEKK